MYRKKPKIATPLTNRFLLWNTNANDNENCADEEKKFTTKSGCYLSALQIKTLFFITKTENGKIFGDADDSS